MQTVFQPLILRQMTNLPPGITKWTNFTPHKLQNTYLTPPIIKYLLRTALRTVDRHLRTGQLAHKLANSTIFSKLVILVIIVFGVLVDSYWFDLRLGVPVGVTDS
jgi:hypothetical protein